MKRNYRECSLNTIIFDVPFLRSHRGEVIEFIILLARIIIIRAIFMHKCMQIKKFFDYI